MIRFAKSKDIPALKRMWDDNFGFDGILFNQFFFEELFNRGKHLLLEGKEIISSVSIFPITVMLHGKVIRSSFLSGIMTQEQYRRRGYMEQLMNELLVVLSHRELFTVITAYQPEIYHKFGFESIYKKRTYDASHHRFIAQLAQSRDYHAEDLLCMYGRFMRHFNGFKIRSVEDFQLLLKQVEKESAILVVQQAGKHMGYCIYEETKVGVKVTEIVYLSKQALETMLAILQKKYVKIEVICSSFEKLDKVYGLPYQEFEHVLIKVHDMKLVNRLFHSNYKQAKDLFSKALWFREDY